MSKAANELSLDELSKFFSTRLENIFIQCIQDIPSLELRNAVEYTLKNGGKRLRPLLVYATGSIFNTPWDALDTPAAAIEFIHTYSLIHDDLPCMDNADLRRGQPSCHITFGEGMAVLAGDALLTFSTEIIASDKAEHLKIDRRLQMLYTLSHAAGAYGMVGGQAMDIAFLSDNAKVSSELLAEIYKLKTGALISASIELGWLASEDNSEVNYKALKKFGEYLGLAFQIQDDILDMEANTSTLGKPQDMDERNKKITYPKLVGLNKAKEKAENLYNDALDCINFLGNRADLLRRLVNRMLARGY